MRRLLLALVVSLAAAGTGSAAEIRSYDVALQATPDGSVSAVAAIVIDGPAPGALDIPLGFAAIRDLQVVEAPAGAAVTASKAGGQTALHLTLPAVCPASVTVRVAFGLASAFQEAGGDAPKLPAGGRLFRHALVNTQPARIKAYRLALAFPDGMRAHAIREALPKLRKSEAGPRAMLQEVEGRPGVRLQVENLQQGDTASLQVELSRRSFPYGWLLAGVVLSVLYLVYFRDLVTGPAK